MLRLRDDRVIAPTTAARRTLAGVVLGLGREPGLLAFSGADTHVHLLVACDRADSARIWSALPGYSAASRLNSSLDSPRKPWSSSASAR